MDCACHASFVNNDLAGFFPVRHADRYNILFVIFFWLSAPYYFGRCGGAGIGGMDWASVLAVTRPSSKPPWRRAGPLAARRQRGRDGRLPAIARPTGTAPAGLAVRRFHHHLHRDGRVATAPAGPYCAVLLSGQFVRRRPARPGCHPTARPHPGGIGTVAQFALAGAGPGTPVFLVNARVSDRSLRGYRRFGFLFRPIFAKFRGVGCQSAGEAGPPRRNWVSRRRRCGSRGI
jgi:hypothetical protein